jgi:hypothetical protein
MAASSNSNKGELTGPEGILMLCIAGTLDIIGFIFFCLSWLAIDDYGILDILGALIIGGWLFTRKGAGSATGALKRFLIAFGVEAVPILGSVSPSWTIMVWKELNS